MENSGGLLVHKATHHFDMINWWIEDEPETVFAFGDAAASTAPTRAERGERCSTCHYAGTLRVLCRLRRKTPTSQGALLRLPSTWTATYRDRCVFCREIDIYDTMSATVRYRQRRRC